MHLAFQSAQLLNCWDIVSSFDLIARISRTATGRGKTVSVKLAMTVCMGTLFVHKSCLIAFE